MDRWMDGWMDRWIDGPMDGWMDVDGWADGEVGERISRMRHYFIQ